MYIELKGHILVVWDRLVLRMVHNVPVYEFMVYNIPVHRIILVYDIPAQNIPVYGILAQKIPVYHGHRNIVAAD